uniref:Helicase POLQ-like (Trinotate prediction) n=1 Tax=Myxobolus squamalis TaxID=59785 RepID=A0A6B2FZL3_MYXSQ
MTGLSESAIYKFSFSFTKNTPSDFKSTFNRWFNTLIVYQIYKGRTLWSISNDFSIPRGGLQILISNTISNSFSLCRFTKEIAEMWHINLLLEHMVKKLSLANCMEVLPLLEISGVKLVCINIITKIG